MRANGEICPAVIPDKSFRCCTTSGTLRRIRAWPSCGENAADLRRSRCVSRAVRNGISPHGCPVLVMEDTVIDPLHAAGEPVDHSLSIVLPVHNAQDTLARDIDQLLDLLPDLTSQFEILIVDDGSTDHSEEIAHELALEYPQVRVTRHQARLGQSAAVRTAVAETTGDVVLIQDEGAEVSSAEIRRLWELRHDQELLVARAEMPRRTLSPHLLDRLANWGEQLRSDPAAAAPGGIQMIRREAVAELAYEDAAHPALRGRGVSICRVPAPNTRN